MIAQEVRNGNVFHIVQLKAPMENWHPALSWGWTELLPLGMQTWQKIASAGNTALPIL